MDLAFVFRHFASGCLPVAAALSLYFLLLYTAGIRQSVSHILASSVFCLYLIGVLCVTGVCLKASFSPRLSLIPFVDMLRGPVDTLLNILLFVPFGVFLPVLYEGYDSLRKVALAAFLVSLSVEIAQLFGFGATDINDLMTNTAGACLGFVLYTRLNCALGSPCKKRLKVGGLQARLEWPLFWAVSVWLMLAMQPQLYHILFRAGAAEIQLWK